MPDSHFVQLGSIPFSRRELEEFAYENMPPSSLQYFQFLLAIETLATLKAISDQLHALNQMQGER